MQSPSTLAAQTMQAQPLSLRLSSINEARRSEAIAMSPLTPAT
jgi:hypothetical protein